MNTKTAYVSDATRKIQLRWLPSVDRAAVFRATVVAVVIGSLLTIVNQSGWLTGNEPPQVLQLILVFLLPFAVVLVSQVAGIRQANVESAESTVCERVENVLQTLIAHGIPARAVAIGLVFGSVNAVLTLTNAYLAAGNIESVAVVPLAQAYTLPFVFGLLSQTISYRRTRFQAIKYGSTT
jgi:hypothetical protein